MGEQVLDSFFGTGTTGAVAKTLHRHWIGTEREERYVRLARERVQAVQPGMFSDEVYVFDTATGELTHRISVGREPHGLAVWPQPGRYSLGHTGNMR